MAKKAVLLSPKDIELNRWCIEMAMRWPVVRVEQSYGTALDGTQIYLQNIPARDVDADVIGRAGKIAAWVKQAH